MSAEQKDSQRLGWQLNYIADWPRFAFAMEMLTTEQRHDCWQYLGGGRAAAEQQQPSSGGDSANTPEEVAKKKKAMSILVKNISKKLLGHILTKPHDPQGAWRILETKAIGYAGATDDEDVESYLTEIDNLLASGKRTMKNSLSLEVWESFMDQLVNLNLKVGTLEAERMLSDEMLTRRMVRALPERLENVKDRFLHNKNLLLPQTLDRSVRAKLKRIEQDQDIDDDSHVGTMALTATKGHDVTPRNGSGGNGGNSFKGKCFICGERGHRARKCPLKGQGSARGQNTNNGGRENGNSGGSAAYLIALLSALSSAISPVKTGLVHWVMDGAAQCGHVAIDKTLFIEGTYVPATKDKVSIKGYGNNTSRAQVEGHGDVMLTLANGHKLRLSGVKYVPNGTANLLAVHAVVTKLQQQGASAAEYRLGARSAKIVADNRTLMTASLRGGLFYLDLAKIQDFQ